MNEQTKDELREAAWQELMKSAEYREGNCCECFVNGTSLGFDAGYAAGERGGWVVERERITQRLQMIRDAEYSDLPLQYFIDELREDVT